MPSIHDKLAIERYCREQRIDVHRLKLLRNAYYKQHFARSAAIEQLPVEAREAFERDVQFDFLTLDSRHDSRLDGASKLIFRTAAGLLIESVAMRMATGRTALCVSSQVGCAANCGFCATGKMGIAKNLTASEILEQVIQANHMLLPEGRRVRNLVFMGMGEPLHNEAELHAALEVLQSSECFNLAPRRVLVSTVGIPDAMIRLVERFPGVRLALSLHSVRPEQRRQLMPISQRHGLCELQTALRRVAELQNREVMIEYLLLKDVNDSPDDVAALVEYLRGINVHINLIPYNPIADAPELVGTATAEREQFSQALKAAGLQVTTRYSLGADIAAACGQLVRRENRAIAMATASDPR